MTGNIEDYKEFGKKLLILQRLITSFHSAILRENGEYVYIKQEIIEMLKELINKEEQ